MLKEFYRNTPAIFLAHGYVGEIIGKTIHGVLMHSELFQIVGLVDRCKAGQDTSRICPGVTKQVPIFSTLEDALALKPKVMILMGDPNESRLPEIKRCIQAGLDVINSSFTFLSEFPELTAAARQANVRLHDLRDVKRKGRNPDGSILQLGAKVVFVTGTDCGLGKRTAAYELTQEAKRRNIRAAFAATGQTGLMLGCDGGIVFDAIPTQFAAGAVEEMLCKIGEQGFDLIFLEGQASLMHYGASNSITLLHAGNPHAIVMVHDPRRQSHAAYGDSPIFSMCELDREISIIENLYLPHGNRFKVAALATIGQENIHYLRNNQPLPVGDVRQAGGPAVILDAVLAHLETEYQWRPPQCHPQPEEVRIAS